MSGLQYAASVEYRDISVQLWYDYYLLFGNTEIDIISSFTRLAGYVNKFC